MNTKIIIITLLLNLFCIAQQFDDPAIRLYDAINYDLDLKLNLQNKSINSSINCIFKPLKPFQILVLSASNSTIKVDSIIYHKQKISYTHKSNHLYINLPETVIDTIFIKIYYQAVSDFNGEFDNGGVYFDLSGKNPKIATSSQPFFARKWFPSKDVPYDKVTAKINITIPETLFAVSNGVLKNVIPNKDQTKTFVWETKYPISTYLIFFAVGNYMVIEDSYESISKNTLPIYYYIFPEYQEKAKEDLSNTKKMLKFMEEYFGPYPFINEKYGIVLVSGDIMMENQTITSIKEDLITGQGDVEQFLIHELAHQWFGNLVTPKSWHHLWLSEGFANYIQALYYEYYLGKTWYHHILNFYMDRQLGTYVGTLVGKSDTSFNDIFSERIYFKGAIVLHMLRKLVGDSTFFKILKTYISNPKFQYSNVTTEDFIETCEAVSGKDLGRFFEQWVYADIDSIDRPVLKLSWNKKLLADNYKLIINIKQLTSELYNFIIPIELTIKTSTEEKDYEITVTLPSENFEFYLDNEPLDVILDKNNWVFKKIVEEDK